jgi:hypothetical protein
VHIPSSWTLSSFSELNESSRMCAITGDGSSYGVLFGGSCFFTSAKKSRPEKILLIPTYFPKSS